MNPTLLSAPFWGSIAGLVAVAAFNSWLSRINQFFFFSRTVGPEFESTPQAKKIVADYLRGVWLGCVAGTGAAMCVAGATHFSLYVCFTAGLLVECAYCSSAFARAHRLTGVALTYGVGCDAEMSAVVGTEVRVPLLAVDGISHGQLLFILAAPVCAAAAWLAVLLGTGMSWSALSTAVNANNGDFLYGMGVGWIGVGPAMAVLIRYFSRSRTKLARFSANTILFLVWCGAALVAMCAATVPLHFVFTQTLQRATVFVFLAAAMLRLMYALQPARRFTPPPVERNGDEYWRWGLFYYNPGDPTLFIQHRAGCRYTLNFANLLSWPLALAFVADLVFLVCVHPYR